MRAARSLARQMGLPAAEASLLRTTCLVRVVRRMSMLGRNAAVIKDDYELSPLG